MLEYMIISLHTESQPMSTINHAPDPSLWASLKPFGIGEQRPNNFAEVFRAMHENRDQLAYAWRILNQGVCDGCALGTTGLQDWTLDGIHLCNIRLRLLRLNTMPAFEGVALQNVAALAGKRSVELREMGRLPYPMLRRSGEAGFQRLSWDAALDLIADHIRASSPERLGFYMTSRGIPNETYYGVQKAVRAMGTNNIDSAARLCHAPSTVSLKASLGVAATTCSYMDWIDSELIVFFGSNVATNQPVATKYLHYARKNGANIVLINPYREPGMERYWIPSIPESALFGTKLAEHFFEVHIGGDVAFCNGTLKHMIANGWLDTAFIAQHTDGFQELAAALAQQSWEELEAVSGSTREQMLSFARMLGSVKRAVLVWSMGITQHQNGEDAVQGIINLGLAKGFVGRTGCGLMPIRGHSGVQGGAEMGAYASVFPGVIPISAEGASQLGQRWGFDVPRTRGMSSTAMLDAAHRGEIDMLFSIGGNFLEVLPDPHYTQAALARVPLRVHYDIALTSQMLIDAPVGGAVLLLPATTRYEVPGGVTETSTERRIIFSPEIAGPRISEARPEADALLELARRVRPDIADRLPGQTMDQMRQEIAQIVPFYEGIQHLQKAGDQFQYGGRHLCENGQFATPNGRAQFRRIRPPALPEIPADAFRLTTRRGKQFNSIVHAEHDAITGAVREHVLINAQDARRLGVQSGDVIRLHNSFGELRGIALITAVKAGNVQAHWPESNLLIDKNRRSPGAEIPDYNAIVWIEKSTISSDP